MSNTTLTPGVHNFTTINVPNGVTVYVTAGSNGVLDLRAQGNVTIAGTIATPHIAVTPFNSISLTVAMLALGAIVLQTMPV